MKVYRTYTCTLFDYASVSPHPLFEKSIYDSFKIKEKLAIY